MAKFEIKQALDAEVFLDVKTFMDESFEFLLEYIEAGKSVFTYSEAFNEMLGAFKAHYAYNGSKGFCWLMNYHFKQYMLKMIDWTLRDGIIDEKTSLKLRRLVQYEDFRVSFMDGRFILRKVGQTVSWLAANAKRSIALKRRKRSTTSGRKSRRTRR